MKKILLTALTALTITTAVGQAFFTPTSYRGAFAPAPTNMWTDTWTEWDPQTKVYPTVAATTVTGNITTSTTWSGVVLLSAQCFVKNNSTLTILPGTVILGDKAVSGAGLFITTGSKLIAVGTVSNPIVFTSNQAPGVRGLGDWGGVVLMGLAPNNSPAGTGTLSNPAGTNYVEGLPISSDTQYGGSNPNDNSGNLQYVRIEFGGYVYQPNKEINGLTFCAVGNATTIDYIQCSFTNDDSFEWFGGNVNCKHLVAYRGLDDDFDTDNGYSGYVQFCLGVRDPSISDNPSVSTSEGFESDNDPSGTANTPLTSAIFSNVTDIGPLRGVLTATYATGFRRGARIRRNSNLKIFNTILMDHATRGVYIDGNACEANAVSGALSFANNIVAGYGIRATESQTTVTAFNGTINAWVTPMNDTLKTTAGILVNPYVYLTPDYRPIAAGIAGAGASFTASPFAGIVTGIANTSSKQIGLVTLSPNPSIDATNLTIFSNFKTIATVGLYDVTGKLVSIIAKHAEITEGNNMFKINTTELTSGVYFVTIQSSLGKETVKLLISK